MIELGDADHVLETRQRFPVATSDEFTAAVDEIVGRNLRAFAADSTPSGRFFETIVFESRDAA